MDYNQQTFLRERFVESDFCKSTFNDCNFIECNCQSSNFSQRRLINCMFNTCNLSNITVENARISERYGTPFFVGLLENFCPALKKAEDYLSDAHVYSINSQRINPEGNRIVDSDTFTDLLLHDLSNAYRFIKSAPISLDVFSVVRRPQRFADHVISILGFTDGQLCGIHS